LQSVFETDKRKNTQHSTEQNNSENVDTIHKKQVGMEIELGKSFLYFTEYV